jgi:predicted  nucleic acid-binding Zn-ribbon protein
LNKEGFRKLKEINSLDQDIKKLETVVAGELSRITKLEELKAKRVEIQAQEKVRLKELRLKFQEVESSISELQTKLERSKSNLVNLFDEKDINSLSTQISSYETSVDELEDQGLTHMDEIETLDVSISDADTYFKGINETISEIQTEVEQENKEVYAQIKNKKDRITNLYKDIPESIHERLKKLLAKNMKFGALTKVSGKECFICKYMLPANEIVKIEDKLELKACGACYRIYIPNSTGF